MSENQKKKRIIEIKIKKVEKFENNKRIKRKVKMEVEMIAKIKSKKI